MTAESSNSFTVGNDEYTFEILDPPFTKRPQQVIGEAPFRVEDRFHRTVKITRLRDHRVWTGGLDMKNWSMNDRPAYVQRWLVQCFSQWDPNAIPDGFEIPEEAVPAEPKTHHCREFPMNVDTPVPANNPEIVDTASDDSFPASDPPEWTGLRVS